MPVRGFKIAELVYPTRDVNGVKSDLKRENIRSLGLGGNSDMNSMR